MSKDFNPSSSSTSLNKSVMDEQKRKFDEAQREKERLEAEKRALVEKLRGSK